MQHSYMHFTTKALDLGMTVSSTVPHQAKGHLKAAAKLVSTKFVVQLEDSTALSYVVFCAAYLGCTLGPEVSFGSYTCKMPTVAITLLLISPHKQAVTAAACLSLHHIV